MGRPSHDLRRWNPLGAPLVPVAEDDRELKISPAASPMRGPRLGSGPDACASLTCDEGSLSEASDIVAPRVLPVTSAARRVDVLAVSGPRVPAIGAGSVNRLPGTSGTLAPRRAIDGRRAGKKPAGLGCRSYSLGSGLSMLRARRPPRNAAAKDSEYHPLMPLVLQTLGRLRCVRGRAPIGVAFSFPVLPRTRLFRWSARFSCFANTEKKRARSAVSFLGRSIFGFDVNRATDAVSVCTIEKTSRLTTAPAGGRAFPSPSWTRGSARTRTRTR